MTALRKIDASIFKKAVGTLPPLDCGQVPQLCWIDIDQLVVDPAYQRDIGGAGKKNIAKIAREFEWARFSPVIVAPHGKDRFAIVDGQHRTTAAALREHKKVPCQVISADTAKQAIAFASINANVTKMSTMQLHAARVAAGDPDAVRLKKVCEAGGVTLLRYPIEASKQKPGQTMAVVQLRQALDRYGEKALRIALQCITRTRHGNPGMVRGLLVLSLCSVFDSERGWLNHPQIVTAFQAFDFAAAFKSAGHSAGGFSQQAFRTALVKLITEFLTKAVGMGGGR
jgi:hypothetical protein